MLPLRRKWFPMAKNENITTDLKTEGDKPEIIANAPNDTKIESSLRQNTMIEDIVYDKQLVNLVNDNIKKVSMWILIISGFLAVIAVLLINSSLRLSIHSNRFIIKTMQMVGATKSFIRKPFGMRSVKLGMLGA